MREWLSGGAPPCQGGGRGFDPRLALEGTEGIKQENREIGSLFLVKAGELGALKHRKADRRRQTPYLVGEKGILTPDLNREIHDLVGEKNRNTLNKIRKRSDILSISLLCKLFYMRYNSSR